MSPAAQQRLEPFSLVLAEFHMILYVHPGLLSNGEVQMNRGA